MSITVRKHNDWVVTEGYNKEDYVGPNPPLHFELLKDEAQRYAGAVADAAGGARFVVEDEDDPPCNGPDLPIVVSCGGYGLMISPEGHTLHMQGEPQTDGPVMIDYFGGVLRVLVYDDTSDEPRYRIVIGKSGEPCYLQEDDD